MTFDSDIVYGWLGMCTESETEQELDEAKAELDDLYTGFEDDFENDDNVERDVIWNMYYAETEKELKAFISDLEDELASL